MKKLLLHACCGPCALEPYRILAEQSWDITIIYSNSNIYPESEFYKRFNELKKWAEDDCIHLIKDDYDNNEWKTIVEKFGEAKPRSEARMIRCGECYKLRLQHAAKYAIENNIEYLSSTLAVSPYQYNDALKEKLNEVCDEFGLKPVFMDFRPYYSNATKRSKELGMYRQKYCGCELSLRESIEQFKQSNNKKYLAEVLSIAQLESNLQL